jgi:hypothetical protein
MAADIARTVSYILARFGRAVQCVLDADERAGDYEAAFRFTSLFHAP